ncbi:hypothetical protein CK203_041476 [Vitis vinifera]|uniref:Uncharacterized protein n=1 Tax=Vitis vinifera TaxID=29760 RepID=A0A438HNE7_VITVI|nr:hypothetical protein CK203_041476 [Vitis vinifera]
MLEATYTAHSTTPTVPPDAPSTSEAFITISAIEFRLAYCYPSSDSAASGTSATPQPDILGPSEPIAPTEETIPAKETTRSYVPIQPTQEATTNASFSHDPTTT